MRSVFQMTQVQITALKPLESLTFPNFKKMKKFVDFLLDVQISTYTYFTS